MVGKGFSRVVGSSDGMLLSRLRSGSDPTFDIVETAGSDRDSVAETGDGVDATLSGDVCRGRVLGVSAGALDREGVVTGAETETGGRLD